MSIESIEARVAKATEGPWETYEGIIIDQAHAPFDYIGKTDLERNADFIAHSRQDIPLLLAVARAAKELADVDFRDLDEVMPKWKVLDAARAALEAGE